MIQIQEDLQQRIRTLEKELQTVLQEKERTFRYRWIKGRASFEENTIAQHRKFKLGLASYVIHSRILVLLTAPLIYLGIVPFCLLDLFLVFYQSICFSIYGIVKVKRAEYLVFDRGNLKYLNLLERLNCVYCSYANGLFAYATEVAARTEQHWCPIKHARRLRAPHSRYSHFLEYGDAERYRREIEAVRSDFVDLRSLTLPSTKSGLK